MSAIDVALWQEARPTVGVAMSLLIAIVGAMVKLCFESKSESKSESEFESTASRPSKSVARRVWWVWAVSLWDCLVGSSRMVDSVGIGVTIRESVVESWEEFRKHE